MGKKCQLRSGTLVKKPSLNRKIQGVWVAPTPAALDEISTVDEPRFSAGKELDRHLGANPGCWADRRRSGIGSPPCFCRWQEALPSILDQSSMLPGKNPSPPKLRREVGDRPEILWW